jgi:ComF family protein
MVYQLKYHNLRAIVPEMVELIIKAIPINTVPGDVIVPVPLHPQRLRERGYNQSALIARELTRRTGLGLEEKCLIRNRNTPSQAHTRSVAERRENVRGAFSCRNDDIKGRRVILIDDVATSGATLNAGALVLKRAFRPGTDLCPGSLTAGGGLCFDLTRFPGYLNIQEEEDAAITINHYGH